MRGAGDPSGLIMHNLLELAAQSVVIGARGVRGGLESMISQYSLNMEVDLDWAMDWSQSDDMHSRNSSAWVHESFRMGMAQGVADGINDLLSDLSFGIVDAESFGEQPMASAARAIREGGQALSGAARRAFASRALSTASVSFKGGQTRAIHALIKHPEVLNVGIAGRQGDTSRRLIERFGSNEGVHHAAMRQIKAFVIQGRAVDTGSHVEFWIRGHAVRVRKADGLFVTFLTGNDR